jgi:hypothetical protein
MNLKLKISGFNVGHVHLDKELLNFSFQKKSEGVCVVWTSLGPLPRWVPGPTTRWPPGTTRLVPHGT